MDDQLKDALANLQDAITRSEADGVIDDDEKAELRELVRRLDSVLGDDDPDGLGEMLEEAAVRFDTRLPNLSAVIRSAVDTLAGYGI